VELGSGCLRKTKILLQALDDNHRSVDYYALDLDRKELERTLNEVKPGTFHHVRCHGLHGTYDDGLAWLQESAHASKPRVVMSMGSTLGSMTRAETAQFLQEFADALNYRINGAYKTLPLMVVGLDGCKDGEKVWQAYNDSGGANERFIRNILTHANRLLEQNVFQQEEWERRGCWNDRLGRHEQYLVPRKDIYVGDHCLKAGQKMFVVASHKYDDQEVEELWRSAGLYQLKGWQTAEHYGTACDFDWICVKMTNDIQDYMFYQRNTPARYHRIVMSDKCRSGKDPAENCGQENACQ
jgi:EasF-like predicted methyltransferase